MLYFSFLGSSYILRNGGRFGVIDPSPCPPCPRMSQRRRMGSLQFSEQPVSPGPNSPVPHSGMRKSENPNEGDEDRRTPVAKRECWCPSGILAFIDIYQSRRRSPSVSVGTLITSRLSLTLSSRKGRLEGCDSWGRWLCVRCCAGGRARTPPHRSHPESLLRHV